jgi:CubicO group peptidase (beta-lactamase class C family)
MEPVEIARLDFAPPGSLILNLFQQAPSKKQNIQRPEHMLRTLLLLTASLALSFSSYAQTYFPPLTGTEWETEEIEALGWCQESVDTLLSYVESRNSKSFIILVDGKIAIEGYFNGHTANSLWYWASAGKVLMATLTGIAQEEGLLSINDPVSQYLGEEWTTCTPEAESERTIWHQLTMTSTFNNSPLFWDCTEPTCFQCDGEAGTQWHYHNGVYRRLHDVVESATGINNNLYTNTRIGSKIGMTGFWTDDQLFLSRTRDMARFGLLALNDYVWDGDTVLGDAEYIQNMSTPSQELNLSYGYLWWLNGQESHYLPLNPFLQQGSIVPTAPDDMYAGLGANDQKVYVVPSMNMVVVRMGETAYETEPSLSAFDAEMWELIMNLPCTPTSVQDLENHKNQLILYPNPSKGTTFISQPERYSVVDVFDLTGKHVRSLSGTEINKGITLKAGAYLIRATGHDGSVFAARALVH